MRSKILILASLFIFAIAVITKAQKGNPYSDIGKKGETLTLTKGQFDEFFDDEDVQQIGTNLVNIRTMKIVKVMADDEAEKKLDNTTGNRFLSVDPLARAYPQISPYQYAENQPIWAIDIDGLEKFVITTGHDRFGRATSVDISGISAKDNNEAVNMNLRLANGSLLTTQEVYEIHQSRRGNILNSNPRHGSLTTTERAIYNQSILKTEGDNSNFDSEFGIENGDEQLGRAYQVRRGTASSVIPGTNAETHQYFDGERRTRQTAPILGRDNFGGVDFITGSLTPGLAGRSNNTINPASVVKYESTNIDNFISSFNKSNNLNVTFIDQITLTIGNVGLNEALRGQWETVRQSLQNQYQTRVSIVVDPNVQQRSVPTARFSSATYVEVSIQASGVSNGDLRYSDRGAVQR